MLDYEFFFKFFLYDQSTGVLLWKQRPESHFANKATCKAWNSRCAGKPAGTISMGSKKSDHPYMSVKFSEGNFYQHRICMVLSGYLKHYHDDYEVDHINHKTTDNRIENLRLVKKGQNQRNQRINKRNKSGLMGVRYRKEHKLFYSMAYKEGENIHLGSSKDLFEAACLRKRFELQNGYHYNHGT